MKNLPDASAAKLPRRRHQQGIKNWHEQVGRHVERGKAKTNAFASGCDRLCFSRACSISAKFILNVPFGDVVQ